MLREEVPASLCHCHGYNVRQFDLHLFSRQNPPWADFSFVDFQNHNCLVILSSMIHFLKPYIYTSPKKCGFLRWFRSLFSPYRWRWQRKNPVGGGAGRYARLISLRCQVPQRFSRKRWKVLGSLRFSAFRQHGKSMFSQWKKRTRLVV